MLHITTPIPLSLIRENSNCMSPSGISLCKWVVDVSKNTLVIGGAFHADEEEYLLDIWSEQESLWGINLYVEEFGQEDFIEFDSMINLRPHQNNRTRSVEDPLIQKKIIEIVTHLIHA